MMIRSIVFAATTVTVTVSAAKRPTLRRCGCKEVWSDANNQVKWAMANGHPDQWGIPADQAKGCVQPPLAGVPVSSGGWGMKADDFQFCEPDTTDGPCIGMGKQFYSGKPGGKDPKFSGRYEMACGAQRDGTTAGNQSAPIDEMTEKQIEAAMAYGDFIAQAKISATICQCDADWSKTRMAELYCPGAQESAKGAVDETTCVNSPMQASLVNNGTYLLGYNRTDQVPPQASVITQWCKVDTTMDPNCQMASGGFDDCSGSGLERAWMKYPNVKTHYSISKDIEFVGLMGAMKIVKVAWSPTGMEGFYPMTFYPEVAAGTGPEDATNLFVKVKVAAQTAAAPYDPVDLKLFETPCDDTCKTSKKLLAETAANASKKVLDLCLENPLCKRKYDRTECPGVVKASMDLCAKKEGCMPAQAAWDKRMRAERENNNVKSEEEMSITGEQVVTLGALVVMTFGGFAWFSQMDNSQ